MNKESLASDLDAIEDALCDYHDKLASDPTEPIDPDRSVFAEIRASLDNVRAAIAHAPDPTPEVWISIIDYPNGTRDAEILDDKPTQNFTSDLADLLADGRAIRAEIRVGNVNGGDSQTLFSGDKSGWNASEPDLWPARHIAENR